MASAQLWNSQMTPEDMQLYKELGQRIAQARKALGLTQTQVAEQLGISQQTLAHYEVGQLREVINAGLRRSYSKPHIKKPASA